MTNEELHAIGQQLRAVRLERDYTLEAAATATRIRPKFLESIEAGEHPDPTLSDMQVRGFLRNYAAFLHLDLDAMLAAYQQNVQQAHKRRRGLFSKSPSTDPVPVPLIPLHTTAAIDTPPNPIPAVQVVGGGMSIFQTGVLFIGGTLLLIVVFVGGVFTAAQLRDGATEPALVQSTSPNTLLPSPTQSLAAIQLVTEESTQEPSGIVVQAPPTNQPNMTGAQRVSISIEAEQRSWLRLAVDDEIVYEGLLRPGTALQYSGTRAIILRTSNAGGLKVVVNNQDLGSLGERGALYEQTFSVDTTTNVVATPTAATTPAETTTPESPAELNLPTAIPAPPTLEQGS